MEAGEDGRLKVHAGRKYDIAVSVRAIVSSVEVSKECVGDRYCKEIRCSRLPLGNVLKTYLPGEVSLSPWSFPRSLFPRFGFPFIRLSVLQRRVT